MFNKFMHDKNPYKDKPHDFTKLALKNDEFRRVCRVDLQGKVQPDWISAEFVRCLTRALLMEDFGLDVQLPAENLVPRVPQRLNYTLLLADILKHNDVVDDVIGLDIGTGASCIYPLLGAKVSNFNFIATDVNENSVKMAKLNAETNFPEGNIKKFDPDETTSWQNVGVIEESGPRSATVGHETELFVEGGEEGFVSSMIEESATLGSKIPLYTTMLGKKSSLLTLRRKLDRVKAFWATSVLAQGRIQRWVLMWTFSDEIDLNPWRVSSPLSKMSKKRVQRIRYSQCHIDAR